MNYNKLFAEQIKQVEGIQVEVYPYLNYIPQSGFKITMPVLFNIVTGPKPEKDTRDPLNICIVLDKSGSMHGTRIDECKKAIKVLISKLNNNDIIHFVTYATDIEVVFSHKTIKDSDYLLNLIENVKSDNMTNISDGLKKAVDTINSVSDVEVANHKKVVFLFSDGEANVGITDTDEMGQLVMDFNKQHKICFSTFGIGDSFNEKLMRGIARCGDGQYNYLDHPEKAVGYIKKALFCMTSEIGTNAVFHVSGCGQNYVKQIMYNDDPTTMLYGKNIGSLNERNIVQILVHMEYYPLTTTNLLEYKLSFTPTNSLNNDIKTDTIKGTFKLESTDDMSIIELNDEVVAFMALREAAELDIQVNDYIEQNNYTKAIGLKRKILEIYKNHLKKCKYYTIDQMYEKTIETISAMGKEGLTANVIKQQNYYGQMACAIAGKSNVNDSNRFAKEECCDDLDGGMDMFGGGGGDY